MISSFFLSLSIYFYLFLSLFISACLSTSQLHSLGLILYQFASIFFIFLSHQSRVFFSTYLFLPAVLPHPPLILTQSPSLFFRFVLFFVTLPLSLAQLFHSRTIFFTSSPRTRPDDTWYKCLIPTPLIKSFMKRGRLERNPPPPVPLPLPHSPHDCVCRGGWGRDWGRSGVGVTATLMGEWMSLKDDRWVFLSKKKFQQAIRYVSCPTL